MQKKFERPAWAVAISGCAVVVLSCPHLGLFAGFGQKVVEHLVVDQVLIHVGLGIKTDVGPLFDVLLLQVVHKALLALHLSGLLLLAVCFFHGLHGVEGQFGVDTCSSVLNRPLGVPFLLKLEL